MEHYFTEKPARTFKREKFDVDILGNAITINSGSGIFSLSEIDFGTKLLIENAKIPSDSSNVLDLGCGYGIVGIAIKKKYPQISLTMTDVNERAIRMAKENIKENEIEAKILKSDVFLNPELNDLKFDVILTNPPFSAGKKVCIEFIKQSFDRLTPNGLFQLVAPHNKGGESLKKIMLSVYGNVGELVKKRGYRVYISVKK